MKRNVIAIATAIVTLGALAAYLLTREGSAGAGRGGDPDPAAAAPGTNPSSSGDRHPPPVDLAQLEREERTAASRAQFLSLQVAFDGGRPDARATERMAAALRQVWPGTQPRWSAPCRNRVCRLEVEGAPTGWTEELRRAPAIAAVADRFAADPDGPAAVAFVLLAAENAPSGAPTLEAVERSLAGSPRVAECLRAATQAGTVEYELFVDTTGITYVRSGTADVEAQSCVESQLADIITAMSMPPGVRSESRRISLRTAR